MSGKRSAPAPLASGPRAPWLLTLWGAALVAVGSLGLGAAWNSWLPTLVLVVVAVVPMVALRLVVSLGVSRWATTVVLGLLLVLAAYLLTSGADTSFVGTLSDSVPRLLTEPLPYPVRADLLVPPLLLTGLVSLFVGLRLDGRTRVGPLAGALLLYVAGALLTTGSGDPWGLLAVLLIVLGLLGWVLLDEHTEATAQRLSVAGPAMVVLVGAVAALALVPSTHPFEPRRYVDPPILVVSAASPLPQLGAWAANPDVELLRVSGDEVPLRLVTLDQYDGTQWTASTRYAPLGTVEDPPLPVGDQRRTATVTVGFAGLGGNWLPSPGTPTSVSDGAAVVDVTTGTLYDPEARDDTTYEVTGVADEPAPDDLIDATVLATPGTKAYLGRPELPYAFGVYASAITQGAATPYARALSIETAVKANRSVSPTAISGSAVWRIEDFLFGEQGTSGARAGTSEQFATAFALLARQNGLPTRVVVGFKPGSEQPDGTRVVRGSDALAWPEVYFDDLGWVPFSPTPNDNTFTKDRPKIAPAPPIDDTAPDQTAAPTASPEPGGAGTDRTDGNDEATAATGDAGSSGPSPWLALVGVLLVPLLLLAGARRVRTSIHLRRGPTGAWSEVLDSMVLAGVVPPSSATATEIADRADQRFGIDATRRVADLAERMAFGPVAVTGATGLDDLRVVRRAARGSLPRWRRWWWSFDPRVLRR